MVYDPQTETYAGSAGTDQNCSDVLDSLNAPAGAVVSFVCINPAGCYYGDGNRNRCTNAALEGDSYVNGQRACACMAAP